MLSATANSDSPSNNKGLWLDESCVGSKRFIIKGRKIFIFYILHKQNKEKQEKRFNKEPLFFVSLGHVFFVFQLEEIWRMVAVLVGAWLETLKDKLAGTMNCACSVRSISFLSMRTLIPFCLEQETT